MKASVFDPSDPAVWRSRGRCEAHARFIADAWRNYPDLPPSASLEDRMARTRQRVDAMRPVFQEIAQAATRSQHANNFAFTTDQVSRGVGGDHAVAILQGRARHRLDWNEAVAYANGWIASHLGWTFSPPEYGYREAQSAAYRQGFADAGGDTDDPFDIAKRQYRAAERASNQVPATRAVIPSRPKPSSWPKPTDRPRPTPWDRRLIILSYEAAFGDYLIREIDNHPASEGALIIILSPDRGYLDVKHPRVERSRPITAESASLMAVDECHRDALISLIGDREFDDILILAQGEYLGVLDAHYDILPLCRNMERAQNSRLRRKAHLRTWLDRGVAAGDSKAAGHIRWSKMAQGVEGRLGEFSGRYEGAFGRAQHLISLRENNGRIASGYVTPNGRGLDPRIVVTSKARIKIEIARALRSFAAATRLSAVR